MGARGETSWQINELIRLDEMITFNPHLFYKQVLDAFQADGLSSSCVKTLFVDQVRGIVIFQEPI